jgi:hypothetical protein
MSARANRNLLGADPNLFCLGAPKCGTTTLAALLDQSPDIALGRKKEPHFFSRLVRSEAGEPVSRPDETDYREGFADAAGARFRLDASTSYLVRASAVLPRILDRQPDARFLVCLRSPVEMAISLFDENRVQGLEPEADFERAWRICRATDGSRGDVRRPHDPLLLRYDLACRLGQQLDAVLAYVPAPRLRVVFLSDMADGGQELSDSLADWLGVARWTQAAPIQKNSRRRQRSPALKRLLWRAYDLKRALGIRANLGLGQRLQRLNETDFAGSFVTATLRDELKAFFRPDIIRVAELSGRSTEAWL